MSMASTSLDSVMTIEMICSLLYLLPNLSTRKMRESRTTRRIFAAPRSLLAAHDCNRPECPANMQVWQVARKHTTSAKCEHKQEDQRKVWT